MQSSRQKTLWEIETTLQCITFHVRVKKIKRTNTKFCKLNHYKIVLSCITFFSNNFYLKMLNNGCIIQKRFNNLTRAWNVASTLSSSCGSIFSSNRLGSGTAIRGTLRLINSSIWKVIGFVRLLGNVKAGLAFKSTVVSHVHFPTVFIAEHVYRPPSSDSAPIILKNKIKCGDMLYMFVVVIFLLRKNKFFKYYNII